MPLSFADVTGTGRRVVERALDGPRSPRPLTANCKMLKAAS